MITPAQSRAARALAGLSRDALAAASGVPAVAIRDFEAETETPPADALTALATALEAAGIAFLADGTGGGAGVRFKFSRRDVKQIDRLENEGGPVAEDDIRNV